MARVWRMWLKGRLVVSLFLLAAVLSCPQPAPAGDSRVVVVDESCAPKPGEPSCEELADQLQQATEAMEAKAHRLMHKLDKLDREIDRRAPAPLLRSTNPR